MDLLRLFLDTLNDAVTFSTTRGENSIPRDLTYISHPVIDPDDQNSDHDISDYLINALRELLHKILYYDKSHINDLCTELRKRDLSIFIRFTIYIIRNWGLDNASYIEKHLFNKEYIANPAFHYEYFHLLRKSFSGLNTDQKNNFFQLLNTVTIDEIQNANRSQEELQSAKKDAAYWRYKILSAIQEDLEGDHQQEFLKLKEKYSEYDQQIPPAFTSYHTMGWGRPSPLNDDQISKMTVTEISKYLKEFQNPESGIKKSEGLGGCLSRDIQRNPSKYLHIGENSVTGLIPAEYISDFLIGFTQTLQDEKFRPLIDYPLFMTWLMEIMEQPAAYESTLPSGFPGSAIRGEVARFIRDLLDYHKENLPYQFRKDVWIILQKLTLDPFPDTETEEKESDSALLAINSIRGNGWHGVMGYARWVIHNLTTQNREEIRASIPEVFELLESYFSGKAYSTVTHSVLGQNIELFVSIDPEWLKERLLSFFPAPDNNQRFRKAAWEGYLQYQRFRIKNFGILSPIYRDYITELENIESDQTNSIHSRLAHHIMLAYAEGIAPLEKDGLVDHFFSIAPSSLATTALEFIGRNIPDRIKYIERAKKLWEWRSANRITLEEQGMFFRWYSRTIFDDQWSLPYLERALRSIEANWFVSEIFPRLHTAFDQFPEGVIACLDAAAKEGDRDLVPKEGNELWQILLKGLSNPVTQKRTEDLIHKLGSLGYFDYRKLLGK